MAIVGDGVDGGELTVKSESRNGSVEQEPSDTNSESRNGSDGEPTGLNSESRNGWAAVDRHGLKVALLTEALEPHGYQVQARWYPGSHTHIVTPKGEVLSLSEVLWRVRQFALDSARCEMCDTNVQATRMDARYCSNACRQRAYRQRKAGAP